MLKRYLVFVGHHDSSGGGGWNDFWGCFDNLEITKHWAQTKKNEKHVAWAHVVDRDKGAKIWEAKNA